MIAKRRAQFGTFFVATALLFVRVGAAHASPKEDPAAVYDRGASAYDRGDFGVAARELAHADELAPNPVTLELALGAALRTDDAVLGMTLAERAAERPGSKSLDALAQSAKKKLSAKVGRLNVVCRGEARCDVTLDGAAMESSAPRIVAIGPHRVAVKRGEDNERFDVTIEAGKQVELIAGGPAAAPSAASPARADPAPEDRPRGVSSTWFWVGVGLTAAVGGAAIASGVDTMAKHDAFVADRSNVTTSEAGRSSETRTVVLLTATGVLAVGTAVLGLFFVDLRGAPSRRALRNPTTFSF